MSVTARDLVSHVRRRVVKRAVLAQRLLLADTPSEEARLRAELLDVDRDLQEIRQLVGGTRKDQAA